MNGEKPQLRCELKYLIDPLQHQLIRKNLCKMLKPDPHAGADGKYTVRNLYFDDFMDSAFAEKNAGLPKRKKYRIRIYNHSDAVIKFECKTKVNYFIMKESVRLTRKEAESIIFGEIDFLADVENPLLREFYVQTRCRLLRPSIILEYEREAYQHPIGNLRITFDTGLRACIGCASFFEEDVQPITATDASEIIMEIKYSGVFPKFVCSMLPADIKPKLALGKYVLCREQQKSVIGDSPFLAKFW
ncbi:MAG: polyphosphate polymerase domain-containing protein [Candidatus Bathyarchaeia archaeon]